jgi:hypothetical protein
MVTEQITITPEYWSQPHTIKYHYRAPNGGLWNVDKADSQTVSVWTVNAWGVVYREGIDRARFDRDWRKVEHKPLSQEFDEIAERNK